MGAQFMPGTMFINLTQTAAQVEVKVRQNGKDRLLTCKKLIAADGLVSKVAKVTGANKPRTNFGMKGPTIEYEMSGVECPYDRGDMFFFGSGNFGGRAGGIIMVPSCHGEGIFRMETMSMLPASTALDLIEFFTKKGPFAHWFKNAEIIEVSGVVIEFLSPMIVPHLGNVLFAGDSAAFGECLYQCAVMCGHKGADCVEKELEGKKGYEEYNQWWGDHFEWVRNPKRMADYTKRVLFPRFFTVKELDFLFDLSEKNRIVVEEADASPYDFTKMVM
jgi:flavin-dependent dehydrogenase